MICVILAAGTGSRLLHMTRNLPKALVPVCDVPLVDYAVAFGKKFGCSRAVVVGGFHFHKLLEHLKDKDDVTLVENTEFLRGSILTLQSALPQIESDCLLLNVDHIYPGRLAAKIKTEESLPTRSLTAFIDYDRPLVEDDMKVQLDSKKRIGRISKTLLTYDAGYVGMTFIPSSAIDAYKKEANGLATENPVANVEHLLQRFVDKGNPPLTFDISGIRWLEIDNQNDLMNAERIIRNVPEFLE